MSNGNVKTSYCWSMKLPRRPGRWERRERPGSFKWEQCAAHRPHKHSHSPISPLHNAHARWMRRSKKRSDVWQGTVPFRENIPYNFKEMRGRRKSWNVGPRLTLKSQNLKKILSNLKVRRQKFLGFRKTWFTCLQQVGKNFSATNSLSRPVLKYDRDEYIKSLILKAHHLRGWNEHK